MIRLLCISLAALLLSGPFWLDSYIISILIFTFYAAYVGQTWNLLLGFSGQLSLGHALYTGLGAYIVAGLFVNLGISPWLTILFSSCICAMLGGAIAGLGFRFEVSGVYFTLLTIAFAECARLVFEHWEWFGGTAGLFIPINTNSFWLWNLRGGPTFFYYLFLLIVACAFLICRFFLKSRIGYLALAVKEDEIAASSLGINVLRIKVFVMALSAGMAGFGGSVFAFYQNSLFPDQTFSMAKSIELTMGSIIGGLGTLIGPIIGSFLLIPLGELLSYIFNDSLPGIKQLFYGSTILAIVLFLPKGIWPSIKALMMRKN